MELTGFINGRFDLIHVGHIRLFEFAAARCDYLIVAVNMDASYERVSGHPPVMTCPEKCEILRSICYIDEVISFPENTPEELIRRRLPECPDIIFKGPERRDEVAILPREQWNDVIPGLDFIVQNGGDVLFPDWDKDHSSSEIKAKINADCHNDALGSSGPG